MEGRSHREQRDDNMNRWGMKGQLGRAQSTEIDEDIIALASPWMGWFSRPHGPRWRGRQGVPRVGERSFL
jgi:hypothetical protein